MATVKSKVTAAFDKLVAKQPDIIQVGTIQQPTPRASGGGPSDPTGGTAGAKPAAVSGRMAVFEIDETRINGTSIKAGDVQIIMEAIAIEVTLDDLVTCDRGVLTIASTGRVAAGGETALYDMVCRG